MVDTEKKFREENKAIFKGCLLGCFIVSAAIIISAVFLTRAVSVSFRGFLDDGYYRFRRMFAPEKYHLVYAEERYEIGSYGAYPAGTIKYIGDAKVYVVSDEEGIYALSAECERGRGIIEKRKVGFLCRKNGALYKDDGTAYYIAAKDLEWYKIEEDEKGGLVVNKEEVVPKGEKFNKAE